MTVTPRAFILFLATLAAGVAVGSIALPRTRTQTVVVTQPAVTVSDSGGQVLRVSILDGTPPDGTCDQDSHFPSIGEVQVTAPVSGELLGLPDQGSVAYDTYAARSCVMTFTVPDLAPSRFYVVDTGTGYHWNLSQAELKRDGWATKLKWSAS